MKRPQQRLTCLWLSELVSWRPGVIGRLLRRFDCQFHELLEQPRERIAEALSPPWRRAEAAAADDEAGVEAAAYRAALAAASTYTESTLSGGAHVTYVDQLYPWRLRHLHDPPPALFVRGRPLSHSLTYLNETPVVAVVGTRAPSRYGREMAVAIAAGLAQAGVLVISGMALGIDAIAQQAALRARRDTTCLNTVGVLGCGANIVYPRANRQLFEQVCEHGLLLSEFRWGVPARGWRFPARNRIIAGLADALVVVEGTERSGSRITANHMLDLGRDTFAVPGEAGRRLSAGPHRLLREPQACICESATDVLEALSTTRGIPALPVPEPAPVLGPTEARVLEVLDDGEQTVDQLAALMRLSVVDCLDLLSRLELEELVGSTVGGRYRLIRGQPGVRGGAPTG